MAEDGVCVRIWGSFACWSSNSLVWRLTASFVARLLVSRYLAQYFVECLGLAESGMSFRVELSLCIICRGLQKCFGAGGRIMQMSITCTGIFWRPLVPLLQRPAKAYAFRVWGWAYFFLFALLKKPLSDPVVCWRGSRHGIPFQSLYALFFVRLIPYHMVLPQVFWYIGSSIPKKLGFTHSESKKGKHMEA